MDEEMQNVYTRDFYINLPAPNELELRTLFNNRKSLTIFDIGCCEGEDSIKYSRLFPKSKIYAFEPLAHNVEIIKRQLAQYGRENVTVFQVALADKVGEAEFFVSSGQQDESISKDDWDFGNKSSSLLPPHKNKKELFPWLEFSEKIKVLTTTIEGFCDQQSIRKIDFVHIDVQGAELKVLSGAGRFIKKIHAIWLEVENVPLYEGQPLKQDVENFMKEHGFINVKDTASNVSGDQFYISTRYFWMHPFVALKFAVKKMNIGNPKTVKKTAMRGYTMKSLYTKIKNMSLKRYLMKRKRQFMLGVMPRLSKTYLTEYPQEYWEFLLGAYEFPKEFWELLSKSYTEKLGKAGATNLSTREKWLEETLLKIPDGKSILDAGAGELQYKKFCKHLNYTSQDFAQYDGQGDAGGLQIGAWDNSKLDIISDITSIPRPDASFDSIMCIEVLEHVPHPVAAIQEMVRLLKPGGWIIITAPFASLTHFSPYHFTTGFSHYFYEYWAKEFGLEILDLQSNGNYFDYIAQELNRLPDVTGKYTNQEITEKDQAIIKGLLIKLAELSASDQGSKELLTYGFHFFARKQEKGAN